MNVSISQAELKSLISTSLGLEWIRLQPESLDIPANITFQQMKPGLTTDAMKNQMNAGSNKAYFKNQIKRILTSCFPLCLGLSQKTNKIP